MYAVLGLPANKHSPRALREVALGPDGKPLPDDKPKKVRKPREPKDKTAGASGTTTTAPRKKAKTEQKHDEKVASDANAQPRQPTITEMVGTFQQPAQPASVTIPPQPQHRNSDGIMRSNLPAPTSNPTTPRPVSSGQNYDPIRGSTMESRPAYSVPPAALQQISHASPHVNRASASPSIASLIDPPAAIKTQALPYSPQGTMQQPFVPSQTSPPPSRPLFVAPAQSPSAAAASPKVDKIVPVSNLDGAMEGVQSSHKLPQPPIPEIKAPSKSSSSAPTPKIRPTPEPPKASGSGLLSSSDLFGGPSESEPSERKGVNIDIYIPLKPGGDNTINIAQEIIKKYGRDAINPRAAAHREQLLRIAAEQDRLGGASNDEMAVDLTSEVEGDSNVEMGGMDDEKSNTGLEADGKPARKRRKKVEEYDKEDDFIDDTELAWQEQAAVAKDGFFVYSGPLVPEGEQPQVESATATKGSRGRGRGSRSKAATGGTTHASLAEKKEPTTNTTTTTTTRGRGSTRARGTGAPRKPRITKAEKERMESEKADRERAAANLHNAGPTANGNTATSSQPAAAVSLAPTGPPSLHPALPSQQQHQQAQSYTAQPIVVD